MRFMKGLIYMKFEFNQINIYTASTGKYRLSKALNISLYISLIISSVMFLITRKFPETYKHIPNFLTTPPEEILFGSVADRYRLYIAADNISMFVLVLIYYLYCKSSYPEYVKTNAVNVFGLWRVAAIVYPLRIFCLYIFSSVPLDNAHDSPLVQLSSSLFPFMLPVLGITVVTCIIGVLVAISVNGVQSGT